MSEVLERVREKYPEYKDIPEDELALRIGTKYPAYLERDETFKSEFQGVVTDRALKSSQAGTLDLIRVLGNPAAGEAAQEGREQDTFSKAIGQQEQPPRSGEERAAAEAASLRGSPFDPLKERERGLRPQTMGERVESTLRGLPLVGKAFTPTQFPYEVEAERSGIKEKSNVANAVRDLLGGLIKPESMALLLTGAGEAQIAKLSPALAQSVKKVVSGYFAWQGTKGVAEALPEAFKPGKTFSERLGHLTTAAGSGAIAGLAGAGLLKEAAKAAEPVAPMTAAAVQTQPAILESAKPEERSTMPQEPLGGIQTPSTPESPAVPPAALEAAPSEQITAASFTHRETGDTTIGQNHIEAAKAQGVEAPKVPTERHGEEYGYEVQDPKTGVTRYVSRDEAEALARKNGQLLTEPTLGKLHSNEIWHAIPFEKRQQLKRMSLSDADIASIESGRERVEDVVQRKFPEISDETKGLIESEITGVLEAKGKPNAIHREAATPVRDVQQPGGSKEGASEVPADETGKEVSQGSGEVPQKASGITGPDLSEGETEPDIEPPAEKVAAPPEEKRVAQALSSTKRFSRETELGGPDILSWMHENMKMLSKTAARLKWGREKFRENKSLWDDAVPMQRAHHNLVFSEKGSTPDVVAQTAYEAGQLSEPSVNELHAAMDAASKKRSNVFATKRREEKFMAEEAKQHTDWLHATKEGERRISADQLKVGDMLEVDDQQVEVTDVDADGNVTLKDGRKFGTQILGEGQSIHVEKWDPSPESEADFAPTEVAPEAQPIEEPKPAATTPKLGAMEKGTGDLLKGVEEEFALVGDKGTDAERVAAEKAKAEKTAQEAKAIEEKQQMELPKAKEREGLLQKQSRLYSDMGTNLNDWLRTATKEQVLEKYRLASEMGPEIDEEIATRKNLGEDFKALNPVKYDVDHLRAVMEHKLMTDFKDEIKVEPAGAPPEAVQQRGKVQIMRAGGKQTAEVGLYTVVEHLPATEAEIANGDQPVRVKNDKTGAETVVLESQLREVQERTAEQREASKGMSRKELDDELRRVGLDPSSFGNSKEKRAALKRAKAKGYTGPGAMGAQDPFDPAQKAQIEQLTEAMKGLKGRKVSLREKIKESFDIGDRVSAAKDAASRAITALKNSGDYVISQWKGKTLDEMLRAKGVLSGELEKRGNRSRRFAKQVLEDIPDKAERAAITKWIDAGGSQQELLWGANHTKPEYRQAYIDAIHLTGDKLTAARQMQSYFEARLQEAIDAGVLQDGIEDYIHRIFEKDPEAAQRMNGYVQSGILSRNPALAKKRIFQMDWEAERLGYKVVQDFVPRIVDYESSLSRAIAAREFVRKMIGFTDENGVRQRGMLAPDGRPVIDVAGLGIPVEDQAGVREATLINPSFKPEDTRNPLNDRTDYKERPEYSALKKWKWATEDAAGRPIYVQGNVLVHKDFVGRIDALLKPSSVRYAQNPKVRGVLRAALTASSTVKQTMLDFSGFHQVQEIVHGAEHGVMPWKIIKDIDFMDPNVDSLMKGGVTLGGEYRMAQAEGLVGRSLSNLIPGVSTLMKTYHSYLFQDFIPRLKMSMALQAFERNKARFANEISSGQMTMDDMAFRTASEANAAFGGLNYTMLERSKTEQDMARLILLAPDFLEARIKFVAQAFKRGGGDMKTAEYWKKGGPLTSNEQRKALLLGAVAMYSVARIANQIISGRPHFEPENAFSVVINGKAYGLRTVQGDVLHLFEQPIQFWMSRLNPVFGRTLLEMGTGRDYFGRKRSAVEQLWDAAATVAPVSLRFGRERSIYESLANGMGITARRYNDADQAFKLAQKWKDKNGIQSKGEFVYDSDKDPLRPLKLALANGDEAGAVKELKKLKAGKSKYNTDFALNTYFNHYATMRFTGSEENDRKFIASLSADEKKTVEAAKQAKMGMRELYFKANAKTIPQRVEPDRSKNPGVDVPIPQFPQRIE